MKRKPHRTLSARLLLSAVMNCSTPLLANIPNDPSVPQRCDCIEQSVRYVPRGVWIIAGEKVGGACA